MSQSWSGRKIADRYQLEDLLGAGGMSAVYRAVDPNLRRVVAVKLIHPHLSINPNFVERFKEEAAAVASLKHPNIVQVHDFNNEGETYYMVMEYLAGETLQARLRRLNTAGRKLPIDEAIQICKQVCDAAGYAHKHDLVHRDIKPANIMLDVNGNAILMDFGIVKIVGGQYHTATGATIGTATYMAPEQIRGERVDQRSDIYSIGVMLYEILSGRPPYESDSALTLMMMHVNDPIPDPGELRDDIPEELTAVIVRALAKESDHRYQTTDEMVRDLSAIKPVLMPHQEIDTVADNGKTPAEHTTRTQLNTEPDEEIKGLHQTVTVPGEKGPPVTTSRKKMTPHFPGWLVIGTVVIILVLLVSGSAWLYFQRRAPAVELMPIEHPSVPIEIENYSRLVNLGEWDLDADIAEIDFLPDSNLLATANNRDWVQLSAYRHYAALWNTMNGELNYYLDGLNNPVYSLEISPDGEIMATSSEDDGINLWMVSDGQLLSAITSEQGAPTRLAFSPNGRLLAGSTWDGVPLWQISNGVALRVYKAGEGGMQDVAFSPDGELLASGDDRGSAYIWNVEDGSILHLLEGHSDQISQLSFSPDGSLLATASDDNTVIVWDIGAGVSTVTLPGHEGGASSLAFSSDGNILATGGWDNTLRLWDVANGTELLSIDMEDSASDLAFSPDGFLLVTANGDRTIQFWGISDAISINH